MLSLNVIRERFSWNFCMLNFDVIKRAIFDNFLYAEFKRVKDGDFQGFFVLSCSHVTPQISCSPLKTMVVFFTGVLYHIFGNLQV